MGLTTTTHAPPPNNLVSSPTINYSTSPGSTAAFPLLKSHVTPSFWSKTSSWNSKQSSNTSNVHLFHGHTSFRSKSSRALPQALTCGQYQHSLESSGSRGQCGSGHYPMHSLRTGECVLLDIPKQTPTMQSNLNAEECKAKNKVVFLLAQERFRGFLLKFLAVLVPYQTL